MTAVAVTFTAIDLNKYRLFSMICYIGMGWCVVGFLEADICRYYKMGAFWLILGGILYTVGAVLYSLGKKKRYIHSIFHLFVNFASLCHFFCIIFFVV